MDENKEQDFYKKYFKYDLNNYSNPSLDTYFYKYLKYKNKYLKLKQKGGQLNFTDDAMNIYLLFITEALIAAKPEDLEIYSGGGAEKRKQLETFETPKQKEPKYPTRIRAKPGHLVDYIENLTPAILEYLTPNSRNQMELDISFDSCLQNKLNSMEESEDPDYLQYENYGKLLECWFGDNNVCPCCGANTLRRYAKDSMPAIDLVCINLSHTIDQGVRFFQVKTSNGALFGSTKTTGQTRSPFRTKPYFNLDPTQTHPDANTIHVGSRTYGDPIHFISPEDTTVDKKILIGYVCIRYRETDTDLQLVPSESFFVLPKYTNSLDTARMTLTFEPNSTQVLNKIDNWYYRYVEPNGTHQRIQFNLTTNTISKFSDYGIGRKNISKAYQIKTISMPNPLGKFLSNGAN